MRILLYRRNMDGSVTLETRECIELVTLTEADLADVEEVRILSTQPDAYEEVALKIPKGRKDDD